MYNQRKTRVVESMSADKINVRRKENKKSSINPTQIIVAFVCVVLLCVAGLISFLIFTDRLSFASTEPEIIQNGAGKIIRVPKGGNLQAAINRAENGDVIELQAGATYNEIVLPKKNFTDFVTIRTSAFEQLPENSRVDPTKSDLLAKIVSSGGKAAVETQNGTNHFRFVGIEFASSGKDYVYNLVYLASESSAAADIPHDLEFDRCYFHATKENVTRRGIAVNSRNTTVKNSYFEGFAFKGEETQGICGWNGSKNIKILNNYIEGGAENVMFGGSDPANAELIPQDIEIRGNHFKKPDEWKDKVTMKTLFELKNAKRVQFVGNYLENNWIGSAFRITVRNQDGTAAFSTIEDVLIKDNIISITGEGINILGKDDTNPSQTMNRLTITNNLFLDLGNKTTQGSGYFIQISGGKNILIANNTAFNYGNIAKMHDDLPENLVVRDNIISHNEYGIHGHPNIRSADGQKMYLNNIIVNNRKVPSSDFSFPAGNFLVEDFQNVGFVNFAQNNFALSPTSRFKAKGANQTDIGCDVTKLPDISRIK